MRLALLLPAALLSACATAEITTPPVMVTPNNPSQAIGLDVYAKQRARGNPVPRFRGQDTVQIRAMGKMPDKAHAEITGAQCKIDSGLYKAQITTPANIAVPNYGKESPALFVRCTAENLSGSMTVDAYNKTHQERSAGAAGAGALGSLIVLAVAAANNDPENDLFAYPNITVQMKAPRSK